MQGMQEMWVGSLGGEAPLEKEMATRFSKSRQVSMTSAYLHLFELRVSIGSSQIYLANFSPYVKDYFPILAHVIQNSSGLSSDVSFKNKEVLHLNL